MLDKHTFEKVRKIIISYLDPKKQRAFIFGSWADDKARKFSDIDIGIEGEQPFPIFELEEALEESDLPYLVEIVNFNRVSEKFKKVAKQRIVLLN